MTTRVSRTTAIGAAATLVGGAGSTLLLALSAAPAGAATTWSVDTLADGAATASDCTTPVPGSCSLRDALAAATVGDTITFASSLFSGGAGTITLTAGDLIDNGVDIIGPGADLLTIDADGSSRVFDITPQASGSTISGLTITGGDGNAGGGAGSSGGILAQGKNTLTVRDCVVTGNTGGYGAGIYAPNLVLAGSTVSDNAGYIGGGVIAVESLVVTDSTIADNTANIIAGGLAVYNSGNASSLTIVGSTISGNSTTDPIGGGGGLVATFATGSVTIANSTFTGNSSSVGGAMAFLYVPTVDISMSTITGNTSTSSDPTYSGGGIFASGYGFPSLTLTGTIVSGNSAGAGGIADLLVQQDPSITGTVTANNSLIGSGVSPNVTLAGSGLLRSDTPMLGALADNGGSTRTMLPQAGSPLLDAGPATIPTFPGNEFDQRGVGFARISGDSSDIGAVEIQVVKPAFTG